MRPNPPLRHHTRPHDPDPVRKAAPLLQRTPEYQYLPKRRRTRLHPVSCPGASQQSSSGAWKGAPRGVGELDVPCLSRFPVRLLPLSHPLVSSSDTSIHSALPAPQIHLFRGGAIPLHTGSLLPLGTPCPWGLPCHLSELTLFCTHRKLRLIEGKDSLDSFAPVE